MAKPETGLEKWELRKLRELNVESWKNAIDAREKLRDAMKARAKANEEKKKAGGFAAIDEKADAPKPAKYSGTGETKVVEVLPATQRVDVTAPVVNVNVPAPSVTINGDTFSAYKFACQAFAWSQAAITGAAIYHVLSSRLIEVLTQTVMR